MAKITVTPELIRELLFPDFTRIEIVGASFADGVVEFEISGPAVPDAARVIAIFKRQPPIVVELRELDAPD